MAERYYRKTAAVVGALFIIATATALASMGLLGTTLDGPDYLLNVAEHQNEVMMAAAFELVLAASVIGIASLMFPILKKQAEGLGLGYAGFRLVEAMLIVVATATMLLMLTMGQGYASGTLDPSGAQTMGSLLMALREWSFLIGTLIFLGLGALTLNYLLIRSQLVPRWLSAWGLVGGACVLLYGLLGMLDAGLYLNPYTNVLAVPIAVQEMVFASWLMIKGFKAPVTAPVAASRRARGEDMQLN